MFCEKTFIESFHLASHKVSHTGVKTFKCMICEMAFNQSSHLKTHKLSHTGEKPFKCMLHEKHLGDHIT